MFALSLPVSVFLWTLFQATPTGAPLRVSLVPSKSFWPENLVEWAGLLSALAIVGGGIWALRVYREGQRVKAAEVLLSMEQEFRVILPTYELIENPGVYQSRIVPMLERVMASADLTNSEIKLLSRLDRCLRFLFLCSVLNQDLAVEQNVLLRAYHHYVDILAEMAEVSSKKTPELGEYIKKFYPTLCKWTDVNKDLLAAYRVGELGNPETAAEASVPGNADPG